MVVGAHEAEELGGGQVVGSDKSRVRKSMGMGVVRTRVVGCIDSKRMVLTSVRMVWSVWQGNK